MIPKPKALIQAGKPSDLINVRAILDGIANAFESLGYEVTRWKSACGEPFPFSIRFDYAVFWGGNANWFPPIKLKMMDDRTDVLYGEVDDFGWYRTQKAGADFSFVLNRSLSPFSPTIGGVCGFRDWRGCFRPKASGEMIPLRDGPLLVVLQDNVNLQNHPEASPIFSTNDDFVSHMVKFSCLPLRIRKHPDYPLTPNLMECVESSSVAEWDDFKEVEESLNSVSAVACIDSHVGVRAIKRNLPVLCYGQAIYRMPLVSARCITPLDTAQLTGLMKHGRQIGLDKGAQDDFIKMCEDRTWKVSDLPKRLERFLR